MDTKASQIIFKVTKEVEIKKSKTIQYWSHDEDSLLLSLIRTEKLKGNKIKWIDVALNFNKNYKQCYSRYRQINPELNKGYWSKDEEDKLVELVKLHGSKWATISKILGTRSGKQIRHHFNNITDIRNFKVEFSQEELKQLIELHKIHGPNWKLISGYFSGRSPDNLKCCLNNHYRKKIRQHEKSKIEDTFSKKHNSQNKVENNSKQNIFSGIFLNSVPATLSIFKESFNHLFENTIKQNLNHQAKQEKQPSPSNSNFDLENKRIQDIIINQDDKDDYNNFYIDFYGAENKLTHLNVFPYYDLLNDRHIIEKDLISQNNLFD